MHGLLLVDKPIGLTSATVVAKIKKHFGFNKVGHGGTLDPFASGLLVLLVGDGTKIARFLLEGDKTYEAEADLRFATDTGDNTGEPLPYTNRERVAEAAFTQTRAQFLGTIKQRPPMYSAIKRNGKPLYAYAREGKTVDVAEREISIRSLEILHFEEQKLRFRVCSSGGTYIRVLAQDWAQAAGTNAHLSMLRRTHSHNFSVGNAHSLETLLACTGSPPLIPMLEALSHIPEIPCNGAVAQMLQNGQIQALKFLTPIWPGNAKYAIALDNTSKRIIAILSKPNEQTSPTIERVFDPSSHQA